jgi:hypothetical protein
MTEVYNLREIKIYPTGFSHPDPATWLQTWLKAHKFSCKVKSSPHGSSIDATKSGTHINFEPKLNAIFGPVSPGQRVQVSIHYYAKVKLGTGLKVGFLTGGLSTISKGYLI